MIRTGRSELIAEITDEMLVAAREDEEHLRIARELAPAQRPHRAAGRSRPGPRRDHLGRAPSPSGATPPTTSRFAEDLARRAAVAIDNAELHSETLAAAVRLQHAVLPDAMPVVAGWDVASYYSPSGRTEVGGDFYDAIPLERRAAGALRR